MFCLLLFLICFYFFRVFIVLHIVFIESEIWRCIIVCSWKSNKIFIHSCVRKIFEFLSKPHWSSQCTEHISNMLVDLWKSNFITPNRIFKIFHYPFICHHLNPLSNLLKLEKLQPYVYGGDRVQLIRRWEYHGARISITPYIISIRQ